MKNPKSMVMALLTAMLIIAGSLASHAQPTRQTTDQAATDSSTNKPAEKKKVGGAPAQKKNSSKKSADSTASATPAPAPTEAPISTAAASKQPTTKRQTPPASPAGMVWVNTKSGVYHKPGTRWYGKTKQGKYMTEADAAKAGYHPAKKE
jgi:cytoskeletal protein RodZ